MDRNTIQSSDLSHSDMKRMVELARKANEERQANHDRDSLKRHISTKFRTTMIGALSRFEEHFGHLWGHGKKEDELTDSQRRCRKVWELVRMEILNNGNAQLRASLAEIDLHTIRYNKMVYHFNVVQPSKESPVNRR